MAADTEQELDEDGLVIQKYDSVVLVIVPPEKFGEQTLRYARSSLYNIHVGTRSVSGATDGLVKGRLQDEFQVDGELAEAAMGDYAGVIVVGCDGPHPYVTDAHCHGLLRAADSAGKLIGAWGNALAVLSAAGVVKGCKVTGRVDLKDAAEAAGGKYTGRETEISGHLVTSRDESAGMRFGQALAKVVRVV